MDNSPQVWKSVHIPLKPEWEGPHLIVSWKGPKESPLFLDYLNSWTNGIGYMVSYKLKSGDQQRVSMEWEMKRHPFIPFAESFNDPYKDQKEKKVVISGPDDLICREKIDPDDSAKFPRIYVAVIRFDGIPFEFLFESDARFHSNPEENPGANPEEHPEANPEKNTEDNSNPLPHQKSRQKNRVALARVQYLTYTLVSHTVAAY